MSRIGSDVCRVKRTVDAKSRREKQTRKADAKSRSIAPHVCMRFRDEVRGLDEGRRARIARRDHAMARCAPRPRRPGRGALRTQPVP
jgi:hypothetical protein